MRVRLLAHRLGYRYRLHRRELPGRPDLVFARRKKAILVHGCFWHQHPGCKDASKPRTRTDYWRPKLEGNINRDRAALHALSELGWSALVIWECETRDIDALARRLFEFLGPPTG
jgi:DNA mismatch endonuclease, patch repair protein